MTTQPSTETKALTGELESSTVGKFWINEKAFCYNPEMQPLITEFQVKAIHDKGNGIYYSGDPINGEQRWIREDFLHKNRYAAYRSLIKQAESEMIDPHSKFVE